MHVIGSWTRRETPGRPHLNSLGHRVESEIEGAAIMGLSLAKHGEITFKNGKVEQGNFDDFPVVRSGDLVGTITRQKILDAIRTEGNGYVQSVMNRVLEVCQKGESLATAFRKITIRGLTMIPVVDQQKLVGIVTLQNLSHNMGLLAESRRLKKLDED